MTVVLRPYQHEAIEALRRELRRSPGHGTAVVLPTGTGKTTVFAEYGRQEIERDPDSRVLYLAHRDELIDQAYKRVRLMAPAHTVGVVNAVSNSAMARHVIASVPSLGGTSVAMARRRNMIKKVKTLVIDEAHHAVAPIYQRTIEHYVGLGAQLIGFTATLSRTDGRALGRVWRSVAYEKTIGWAIGEGFLVRPVGIRVQVDDLHLERLRSSGGDLAREAVGEAIESSLAPEAIAKAMIEHAGARPTILFAPTVHSAGVIEDALRASGFTTALVHGAMAKDARKAALGAFRAGKVQVLVNVMVLTEGTDLPRTSCIVIARPTKSRGLYQQMVGRGLRIDPDDPRKVDCLVLDLTGATALGLASCTDLFGGEDEQARKPCYCSGLGEMIDGSCPHARCHDECLCGGGRDCGCSWEPEERGEPVEVDEPIYADGPLKSTIIDLFSGSPVQWLRTVRGVPFLPAGERYIAIVPSDPALGGGFDVVSVHWQDWEDARYVTQGCRDFAMAMRYGEDDLTIGERRQASKDDGFRKRRMKSSETQRAWATAYGISADPGILASELQQRLAEAGASARIDPCLPEWY